MKERFTDYRDPQWEQARRGWPRGMEFPQLFVFHSNSVRTEFWLGNTTADGLRDEIEARRSLVRQITIQSSVIDRTWPVELFDRIAMKPIPPPTPSRPGVSISFETVSPPQRIELIFQSAFPAARLRVIAAGPQLCTSLYDYMSPHVEAGSRPRVWDSGSAGLAGVLCGAVAGALFYAMSIEWLPIVVQMALGFVGWLGGRAFVRWAFPPLELVESWERSRWQAVKAAGWQTLLFLLGIAGVVITIVLST